MSTNAENMKKIGRVLAEIFVGICRFLASCCKFLQQLAAKISISPLVISGDNGPTFT